MSTVNKNRRPILLSVLPAAGWIVFSMMQSGCGRLSAVDYSQFENFSPEGIPEGWVADFNPYPLDSTAAPSTLYDVIVTVRYNSRCSSRNFVVDVEQYSLNHPEPDSMRIDMQMFFQGGRPVGTGNLGLYEVSDTIRRNLLIPEGYTVSLSSPLPPEQTAGVNAVGVRLSKSGMHSPFDLYWLK